MEELHGTEMYRVLYHLNYGYEPLVIADILNTILVIRGARKAYLPQRKLVSLALSIYFAPHVKLLTVKPRPEAPGNLGMGDMAFVVREKSTITPPTTQVEIGKLLGYPCADEWDRSITNWFYEITAMTHTGDAIQLFAFVCKTEEKLEQARALTGIIAASLLSDPLARTLVKSVLLRKGVTDEHGRTTYTNISRSQIGGTRRRKRSKRRGRKATRRRRS